MSPVASSRSRLLAATLVAGLFASFACSDEPSGPSAGLDGSSEQAAAARNSSGADVRAAIRAQERHTPRLMRLPGVVGTAVGLNPAGKAVVRVFTTSRGVAGIPGNLDEVPVAALVTGVFVARSDPTTRQRPAPVGFSVGHPDITAGTIGARVKDGSGNVYILSNNHVLANSNGASIGDNALQPGPADGGEDPADRIGDLFDFQVISFSGGSNTMDAAIARSSTAELGNSTPTDDGYGTPGSAIFGDGNNDGVFDDKGDLLGLAVQKYGRTTKLTKASITEINVTVTVCYEGFIFCTKSATFTDQIGIGSSSFSDGGDSGSLIVTDDGGRNPVGLLFAGSSTRTLANRIDLVLDRFDVTVDGGGGTTPPPPAGDSHVGDLDRSATTQNAKWTASVTITVHDDAHAAVANATVSGSWSAGASGSASCTTGGDGKCTVQKANIQKRRNSVTFSVTGVSHGSLTYASSSNHDPDGDSNGTAITVTNP